MKCLSNNTDFDVYRLICQRRSVQIDNLWMYPNMIALPLDSHRTIMDELDILKDPKPFEPYDIDD